MLAELLPEAQAEAEAFEKMEGFVKWVLPGGLVYWSQQEEMEAVGTEDCVFGRRSKFGWSPVEGMSCVKQSAEC